MGFLSKKESRSKSKVKTSSKNIDGCVSRKKCIPCTSSERCSGRYTPCHSNWNPDIIHKPTSICGTLGCSFRSKSDTECLRSHRCRSQSKSTDKKDKKKKDKSKDRARSKSKAKEKKPKKSDKSKERELCCRIGCTNKKPCVSCCRGHTLHVDDGKGKKKSKTDVKKDKSREKSKSRDKSKSKSSKKSKSNVKFETCK